MHEQAYLLDCIGDIGTGECQVLESTSQAAIQRGIVKWNTIVGRQFGACIDRGGNGIAVEHFGTVKYLESVLLL
jgi:hypothetical protein